MKIKITSHRGHHEADVAEVEVAKAIFEKMTGKTNKALGEDIKTKVPDTFQELQALWTTGKMGYAAVTGTGDNLLFVKDFDEKAQDMIFIAPVTGG